MKETIDSFAAFLSGCRSLAAMEDIRVETSMGAFTVELYPKQAPKACHNFSELCAATSPRPLSAHSALHTPRPLARTRRSCWHATSTRETHTDPSPRSARRGYYDGIAFHRIITDFMIQVS